MKYGAIARAGDSQAHPIIYKGMMNPIHLWADVGTVHSSDTVSHMSQTDLLQVRLARNAISWELRRFRPQAHHFYPDHTNIVLEFVLP